MNFIWIKFHKLSSKADIRHAHVGEEWETRKRCRFLPSTYCGRTKKCSYEFIRSKIIDKKFNNCITFEQRNLTYNAPFIHNCPQLSNKAEETKNFIFQTNKTYIKKYLLLSWAGMTPNLVGIPNKIPSASAN